MAGCRAEDNAMIWDVRVDVFRLPALAFRVLVTGSSVQVSDQTTANNYQCFPSTDQLQGRQVGLASRLGSIELG